MIAVDNLPETCWERSLSDCCLLLARDLLGEEFK